MDDLQQAEADQRQAQEEMVLTPNMRRKAAIGLKETLNELEIPGTLDSGFTLTKRGKVILSVYVCRGEFPD